MRLMRFVQIPKPPQLYASDCRGLPAKNEAANVLLVGVVVDPNPRRAICQTGLILIGSCSLSNEMMPSDKVAHTPHRCWGVVGSWVDQSHQFSPSSEHSDWQCPL